MNVTEILSVFLMRSVISIGVDRMRISYFVFCLFICLIHSFPLYAVDSGLLRLTQMHDVKAYPKESVFFTIDPLVFDQHVNNPNVLCEVTLPVAGKEVPASLKRFSIMDEKSTLLLHSFGVEKSFKPEKTLLLSGVLENEEESFVYLAVFERYCAGYIERMENNERVRYLIAPLSLTTHSSTMIVYRDNGHSNPKKNCFAEELPEYSDLVNKVIRESGESMKENDDGKKKEEKGERILNSETLTIQLALDLDDALYNAHQKDFSRAVNYVVTVWGGVAAIYRRDANVTFRINYMRVWTSTDPYPSTNTGMLGQFREYWNANMRHVKRTLAHLMSGHGFGGVAWVGVLCNNVNDGVGYAANGIGNGVVYPAPTYVWDLDVVSHETGHNFGSPHTHSCSWNPAVDSCYQAEGNCYQGTRPRRGTIMSYCHLTPFGTQLFFHPRVASLLRDRAEKAACVYPESNVMTNDIGVMDFVTPQAGAEMRLNTNFTPSIRIANNGTSARQPMKMRFEIRNPQSNAIRYIDSLQTPALNAGQSAIVSFKPTSVSDSGQWLFRAELVGTTDSNLHNDDKTVPVYFTQAQNTSSIQVLDINSSITVDAGSNYVLKWKATNCKTIRILLTTDDGNTWENIISNYSADSAKYIWNVPFFPTSQARIRIENFENSAVSDISDRAFTIRVNNDVQPIEFLYPEANSSVKIAEFIPSVLVKNNGVNIVKNVPVILKIKNSTTGNRFYRDTVNIDSIKANSARSVNFDTVVIRSRGTLEMIVRTFLDKDVNTYNDSLIRVVTADTSINAPILIKPANGSFTNPDKTVFKWHSVKGAKNYIITNTDLRTKKGAGVLVADTVYSIDRMLIPNDTLKDFTWSVTAVFDNGAEVQSETWSYVLPIWEYNNANKSFFTSFTGNTWLMALGQAKSSGVYMATVRNKQENDFLRKEFSGDLRVGLTDRQKEGDWKWISGEPRTYSDWAANQPDNYQNNEHFMNLTGNGLWNDINENQINHSTLFEFPHYLYSKKGELDSPELLFPQKDIVILSEEQVFVWNKVENALGYYIQIAADVEFSEPIATVRLSRNMYATSVGQLTSNGNYFWRVRSFNDSEISEWSNINIFKFVKWKVSALNGHGYEETPNLTWEEANQYAERFGAFLATVRSKEENKWIDSVFGVKNKWIGINDREKEGEYVWASGEKNAYTNWNTGEPNNYGTGEDYGHIGDNAEGKWNDINETARFTGIMERISNISPAPVIIQPQAIHEAKSFPIVLQWRKNSATSIYNIQIARDPEFKTIITDESQANDTTFTIKSIENTTVCYWRIRSRGNSTFGEWSDRRIILLPENDKDLIVHWVFDNVETGTVFDKSSKRNNAKVVNSYPKFSAGEKGIALDFDGLHDALISQLHDNKVLSDDFTFCFWLKKPHDSIAGTILDAYSENENKGVLFTINRNMSGTSDLVLKIDTVTTTFPLRGDSERSRHFAIVKNAGQVNVFYDSYCSDSVEFEQQSSPINSNIVFGAQTDSNSNNITNTVSIKAEDIRLYKRALSVQELRDIIGKDVTSVNETPKYNTPFSITPNPAHSLVKIVNNDEGEFKGSIYSSLGILQFYSESKNSLLQWDCTDISSGIYFVILSTETKTEIFPIIVTH